MKKCDHTQLYGGTASKYATQIHSCLAIGSRPLLAGAVAVVVAKVQCSNTSSSLVVYT